MSIKKYIQNKVRKYLNEDYGVEPGRFFDSFPESVMRTLDNEYDDYNMKSFDWNEKSDEFSTPQEFNLWRVKNKSIQFLKNIDYIIKQTTEDIILIQKQKRSRAKLNAFEELIKPSLGNAVLSPALSKFEEEILMNPNASIKDIEKGFKEAKNIIDNDGNIDSTKTQASGFFTGGDINIAAFERFAEANPEFKNVYVDWKKMFDEDMDISLKNLNAYRSSTTETRIRELRDFLITFKQRNLN